jgi:uncharacterized membrane protein
MEESALNKPIKSIVDAVTSGNVNVGEKERWLSILGGGALVLYGLKKKSWPSLALALAGGAFVYRGVTGHCPAYQALKMSSSDKDEELPRKDDILPEAGWVNVEKSILIRKEPEALYAFLQNVENLPQILDHLESVRKKNHHLSHWIAKATKGTELEWEAEAIDEKLNEQVTWRALEEGGIDNLLSFRLEKDPSGEGSQARLLLQYNRDHSLLGAAFARLFGNPEKVVEAALDRLKQIIETDEAASEAAA